MAIGTRRGHSKPALQNSPAVDAFEVARDRCAVVAAVLMFAVAVAADLHDVQRKGARFPIAFVENVVRAVAGDTGGRVRVSLGHRFCMRPLKIVGLCSLMTACITGRAPELL